MVVAAVAATSPTSVNPALLLSVLVFGQVGTADKPLCTLFNSTRLLKCPQSGCAYEFIAIDCSRYRRRQQRRILVNGSTTTPLLGTMEVGHYFSCINMLLFRRTACPLISRRSKVASTTSAHKLTRKEVGRHIHSFTPHPSRYCSCTTLISVSPVHHQALGARYHSS